MQKKLRKAKRFTKLNSLGELGTDGVCLHIRSKEVSTCHNACQFDLLERAKPREQVINPAPPISACNFGPRSFADEFKERLSTATGEIEKMRKEQKTRPHVANP